MVKFPKRGCYRVQFRIVPPEKSPNGDDLIRGIDDWNLYIGPDYDSLQRCIIQDVAGQVGDNALNFQQYRF